MFISIGDNIFCIFRINQKFQNMCCIVYCFDCMVGQHVLFLVIFLILTVQWCSCSWLMLCSNSFFYHILIFIGKNQQYFSHQMARNFGVFSCLCHFRETADSCLCMKLNRKKASSWGVFSTSTKAA